MMDYQPQPPTPVPATASPLPVAPPPPRRRRRWRRGCLWVVLAGVLALMFPVFLAGAGLLLYLLFPPAPLDIVILGLDARQGEGYVARADSIMLLGVQPRALAVSVLSIPRDVFIETPGYGLQRINTINVLGEQDMAGGGPALVKAAIAVSFSVEPDRYMRLNFDAFTEVIDALGGIDVEVPYRLVDYQYPTEDHGTTTVIFEPGWQHMDGETALAYARTRHADDDYRRAERQQQVLAALFRAMLQPDRWPRLPGAVKAFFEAVDTDMNFLDILVVTPPLLLDGATGGIEHLVIDRDLIRRTLEGQAVPDYAALRPWLDANFD